MNIIYKMYALFAQVNKKNQITSLNLKTVLSSEPVTKNLSSLESKLETETSYTVSLKRGIGDKFDKDEDLLKYFIKYSNTGLFYISKLDPVKDDYHLIVPGLLFSNYKQYLIDLKKAYGKKHKKHMIHLKDLNKKSMNKKKSEKENAKDPEMKLFNSLHTRLLQGKVNAPVMMNRIIAHIMRKKFDKSFTDDNMKELLRQLDNKSYKQKGCVYNFEKYFKIKPDPCKTFFRFNTVHKSKEKKCEEFYSKLKSLKEELKKLNAKTEKTANDKKRIKEIPKKIKEIKKKIKNNKCKKKKYIQKESKEESKEETKDDNNKSKSSSSKKSSSSSSSNSSKKMFGNMKKDANKEKERQQNKRLAKQMKERFKDSGSTSDSEKFTKELKKNDDEHPIFPILRALVITCIVLAILGNTNKLMYRALLSFLTSPLLFTKNLINQFGKK